jgi:hypothetical protein
MSELSAEERTMLTITIEHVLASEDWAFDHPYCLYVVRDGEFFGKSHVQTEA